jgi:hypothetical protein
MIYVYNVFLLLFGNPWLFSILLLLVGRNTGCYAGSCVSTSERDKSKCHSVLRYSTNQKIHISSFRKHKIHGNLTTFKFIKLESFQIRVLSFKIQKYLTFDIFTFSSNLLSWLESFDSRSLPHERVVWRTITNLKIGLTQVPWYTRGIELGAWVEWTSPFYRPYLQWAPFSYQVNGTTRSQNQRVMGIRKHLI